MFQPPSYSVQSIGLLILRLGLGGYMLTHGWGKFQRVISGNLQFGDPLGIGPEASLILAAGAEFGCAILVILGLFTRFAAIPLVFTMGVAAFIAHGGDPWTMSGGREVFQETGESWASKEPALMYLLAFLPLVFTGAGKFSLDGMIAGRKAEDS